MTPDIGDGHPILIVAGDDAHAELARTALTRARRVVRAVRRVDEALRLISSERFGLAILDHRLEDGDAWPVVEAARALSPRIPVIVVTAMGDELVATEALHRGASAYLIKTGSYWERLPELVERFAREGALANENALLASVVQHSDDAILAGSLGGEVMSWNPAAARMFGYEPSEIVGRPAALLFPAERAEELAESLRLLAAGEPSPARQTVRLRKDGTRFETSETISPIRNAEGAVTGAAIVIRDITAQKSLEAQLRQAQKMEAVGRLAGGVAHDFNNVLTVITGYGEMLGHKLGERDPLRNEVTEILRAAERATRITEQLLAFSRKRVSDPQVVGLNDVIREMGSLLRRLLGEDVELMTVLEATSDRVKVDPGQIEQVVVNLAVNARDAMPDGGDLTISTRNVELDRDYARHHPGVLAGPYVTIAVRDTGTGMDAGTIAQVFEPFFTTKGVGKGTGLGLSTVHGIVTQNGGLVAVESEPGRGATFTVYLPREEAPVEVRAAAASAAARTGGSETILLAEDDPSIRALVRRVLAASGYTVLEARDGREALSACEGHPGAIHLLITDVVMQTMGGPDVARELAIKRPDTRVLYMSGHSDEAIFRQGRLPRGTGYLAKPFTTDHLLRRVREILDAART